MLAKHVSLVVAFIDKIFDFFLLQIIKVALLDYSDSEKIGLKIKTTEG